MDVLMGRKLIDVKNVVLTKNLKFDMKKDTDRVVKRAEKRTSKNYLLSH